MKVQLLVNKLKSLLPGLPELTPVDPEKFNDPLASQTSWQCLKSGSANFTTHKLFITPENNLVYRSTALLKAFGIPFIIVGLALLYVYYAAIIPYRIMMVMGPILTAAGIVLLVQSIIPIGFDYYRRLFYSGFRKNGFTDNIQNKHYTSFNHIHAVQILTKVGKVSSSSENYHEDRYFYAYELNLVLHDGGRKYVMTYINAEQALADADEISKLIKIPVWNAIIEE